MNLVDVVVDRVIGKIPITQRRSSKWGKVRASYLKEHPECECCGSKIKLNVHHVAPFHLRPDLELDRNNLITLCEGGKNVNCHLILGHLLLWKSYNRSCVEDARIWRNKIVCRPTERDKK